MSCNRLRLTSDGKLRNCLFSLEETDVRGLLRGGGSDAADRRGDARLRGLEVGGPRNQYRPIHPAGTADALDRRLESFVMSKSKPGNPNHPGIEMDWLSRARDAALVAREHRVTFGYHLKRSSGSPNSAARPVQEFSAKFVRRVGHRLQPDRKARRRLYFLGQERGCTVYPARPVQCQTWPFWPENVESPRRVGPRAIGLPGFGSWPPLHGG